jgi:hypothetical protein
MSNHVLPANPHAFRRTRATAGRRVVRGKWPRRTTLLFVLLSCGAAWAAIGWLLFRLFAG